MSHNENVISNDEMLSFFRPERALIQYPHPEREVVNKAFLDRVKDALKMYASGITPQEIQAKHGAIVLKEVTFKWKDFWSSKVINKDGHAVDLKDYTPRKRTQDTEVAA